MSLTTKYEIVIISVVRNFKDRETGEETFSLDELVEKANQQLPRYLAHDVADARVRDVVNARLVRHLTTLGLLDEAWREGREARYGARHLLQLLVTRRLMSEGLTTGAIKKLVADADDEELGGLLQKGARLATERESGERESKRETGRETLAVSAEQSEANRALDFLKSVKSRGQPTTDRVIRRSPAPASAPTSSTRTAQNAGERWTRLEIAPGLEVHVREDFRVPPTPHERDNLLQTVWEMMKNVRRRTK